MRHRLNRCSGSARNSALVEAQRWCASASSEPGQGRTPARRATKRRRRRNSFSYKAEVGGGVAAQIGEDGGQIVVVNTKPSGQRGKILVGGRGRDPPPGV